MGNKDKIGILLKRTNLNIQFDELIIDIQNEFLSMEIIKGDFLNKWVFAFK